jgi:hypothetical protein
MKELLAEIEQYKQFAYNSRTDYDAYRHALKDYGRATAEYYVNLSVQQAAGDQSTRLRLRI